jgi:glycosyltransferase involved in cell wall biosynthesis
MAQADIVCFTSRGDAEGMPGVLIEAGFAARPLVATSVTGVSAVVDHGETGLIVDVGDQHAFTDAVETLAGDAELRDRLGKAARRRCVGEFTLEASAARWRSVIDEVS